MEQRGTWNVELGSGPLGTLYIVATPIGNLEDITLRAVRVLGAVSLVACEDTRTTGVLLKHHGITAQTTAFNEHNAARALPRLLDRLGSGDIALVSDAGTPLVSDPGADLVRAAAAAGHAVVPIPGASAVLAALVASGLPSRAFTYVGFLPHAAGERRIALAAAAREPRTVVLFESPHRVRDTLAEIATIFGERPLAVCRELTKLYEETWRGTATGALAHFESPRGEFTLVISGVIPSDEPDRAAAMADLAVLKRGGMRRSDACAEVARRSGVPRRELYAAWDAV